MFQARKKTDLIVVHCSATRPSQDIGAKELDKMHRARGFFAIGYHWVIRRDGTIEKGRPADTVGAHVEGYNARSIGICMVGGVKETDVSKAEDNFTDAQFETLSIILGQLHNTYPDARICGHRDLSPDLNKDGVIQPREWLKQCPAFDVAEFLKRTGIH